MQVLGQARLGGVTVARIVDFVQSAARQQRIAHRRRLRQDGLLFHERDPQPGLALHLAIVQREIAGEHA